MELEAQGISRERIRTHLRAHIRYAGTDTVLPVEATFPDEDDQARLRGEFERLHRRRFGFVAENKALVIDAVEVETVGGGAAEMEAEGLAVTAGDVAPNRRTRFYSQGAFHDAPVALRSQIRPGQKLTGPAIIIEANQTIVVEDGWQAELTAKDHIVLRRIKALPERTAIGTKADPVMLEIFNNLFMSIAEQMGVTLQNTAYSVNIKERLDFSCAVFDNRGNLVANAPHMPVPSGLHGRFGRDRDP